jgi:flagellar basal-body rod protein FlgB
MSVMCVPALLLNLLRRIYIKLYGSCAVSSTNFISAILKKLSLVLLYLHISVFVAYASENSVSTDQLLKASLELAAFRHKVLSTNIANLNTPGYKADEVPKASSELDLVKPRHKKLKLKVTSYGHMRGNARYSNDLPVEKLKDPDEVKMNGNNVSLRQQMSKLSDNQIEYDSNLQTYKATTSLFGVVLGK